MTGALKRWATIGAAVTAVVAAPAVALAATTPTAPTGNRLSYCQGRSDAAITRRLTTLAHDAELVQGATHLTAGDRSTLANLITNDQAGLSALKTKVDDDSTLAACRSDGMTIVTAYRIYVLVEPQVHLTIAADRLDAVAERITDAGTRLQAIINRRRSQGKEVDPGAQDALNDLNAKVAAATAAAGPVPAEVLALTPSGYPGNRSTLMSARASLRTARQDLAQARADAARARALLR
jgi:hypothetical protein